MALEVTLSGQITIEPAKEAVMSNKITVLRIIDNYQAKKVIAETKERGRIILWENEGIL